VEPNPHLQQQHAGDHRCSSCHQGFGDVAQLAMHVCSCAAGKLHSDEGHDDDADSDSNDTIIDERFSDSKPVKTAGDLRAVYDFVEHVEGAGDSLKVKDFAGVAMAPLPTVKLADGVAQPKKRGRKPKDKSLVVGTSLPAGANGEVTGQDGVKKKRGRKKKVIPWTVD
jgi:hypothetical protein